MEEATNSIKRSNSSNDLVEMGKGIKHLIHVASKIKNDEGKSEAAASLCEGKGAGTAASFCERKKRFIILNPNPLSSPSFIGKIRPNCGHWAAEGLADCSTILAHISAEMGGIV